MRRSLIVTGDDFGFSRGVNRAILEAHERGILTSASLMVTGEAFQEAVALARAHPALAVGLHLVVAGGRSVLRASELPHLVETSGQFVRGSVRLGLRYQFSRAAREELRREIAAQLATFRATGLPLSHVDGHLHMHMHPVVLGMLVELAGEFGIRAIRLPSEELGLALALDRRQVATKCLWAWIFRPLRRAGERRLAAAGLTYPERVYGLLATGRLTESYLLSLIPKIRANHVEIYAHPAHELADEPRNGPPGAGPAELLALMSDRVRAALALHGFELARYS